MSSGFAPHTENPDTREVDLSDLQIVDFSRVLAGPYATQVLAGLGADVIKVEFPSGDPSRSVGPHSDDLSLYYAAVNTGKRGVVIDPRTQYGREAMHELLQGADAVVHNFRTEASVALGLDPDTVLTNHPHLVLVTVSGYASGTFEEDRPAFDLTIQAESGLMAVTGYPGQAPVRSGAPVSDLVAGLWTALAVTSGLLTQRQRGSGLHVEVPLLDASLPLLSYMGVSALVTGQEPQPVGSGHHRLVPYRSYATRDGQLVIAVLADKFWLPLCAALDLQELAARPDLRRVDGRRAARAEIDQALEDACATRSTDELLACLAEAGVPSARVHSVTDALTSSYARTRGCVAWIDTPNGSYPYLRGPFDRARSVLLPAPNLGQHNEEVLGCPTPLDEASS